MAEMGFVRPENSSSRFNPDGDNAVVSDAGMFQCHAVFTFHVTRFMFVHAKYNFVEYLYCSVIIIF